MNRHVRTTLVYGLISALAVMPLAGLLAGPIGWPMAFKLVLWLDLFIYAALLARWSGKGIGAIVVPTALLLGTALWPGVYTGFFFLGLGVFSWIRSGSCFYQDTDSRRGRRNPHRRRWRRSGGIVEPGFNDHLGHWHLVVFPGSGPLLFHRSSDGRGNTRRDTPGPFRAGPS
jgi:hypothetical protein